MIFAAPDRTEGLDFAALEGDELMEMLSYFNPPGYSSMGVVNSARWHEAEVPSTNGHGTATGVARMYAGLLEPGRVVSVDLLAEAVSPQSRGYCPILHEDVTFGLGFTPTTARRVRSEPRELRPLRHRWCRRFRRSPCRRRVRLRHEPCDPPLAEHAEPLGDRRGVRRTLTVNGHWSPARQGLPCGWPGQPPPGPLTRTLRWPLTGEGSLPRRWACSNVPRGSAAAAGGVQIGGDMTDAAMAMPTRRADMWYAGSAPSAG